MSRRGFTLLEVLVAVAILGIILTTVYGAVARTLQSKNRAEARAELYAAGREAVLRMADEIEGALPPPPIGSAYFVGVPGNDRVPNDAVQFVTVIRRQFSASQNQGGRAIITYQLDPMEGKPSLFYLRRQEELLSLPLADTATTNGDGTDTEAPTGGTAHTDEAANQGISARYVLDRVAGMRILYYNSETGEFDDSWDTDAELPAGKQPTLPGAVRIVLFLADEDGNVHDFGTIADLPLANLQPTPHP
jgi:prepilin-type N-terminal cleavage/methylation domain-containing protein